MRRLPLLLLIAAQILSLYACNSTSNMLKNTQTSSASNAAVKGNSASDSTLPVLSPDKPVTLDVWLTTKYTAPAADNKLIKLMKEKLGVTINYEIVTPDNAEQKIDVMLSGAEYPDLIGTVDQNARFITGNALIPLDDYLKAGVADNLYTHVQPYWNRLAYDAGSGKHIYILPNYNRYYGDITGGVNYSASGFWLQKAVLEDAGYPDLSNMTLDRYFRLIEDYMKKYPTIDNQPTIGFEIICSQGREWGLTNPPEYLAGFPNDGGVIVENGIASIFANKDIAKTYYKYLNEMNARGIVDRESFTQNLDQYEAKLASGRVLGMYDQRWDFGNANDALISAKKGNRTWVPLQPVYSGKTPYYADRDVMNIYQGFGVSVSSKQPEVAVSFLNTMLSEEWQKILSWGIEGEDYMVGADGKFTRSQKQRNNSMDLAWQASNQLLALKDLLPKHNGQFSDGNSYSPNDQPAEFFANLSYYDKHFLTKYNKQTWRDFNNQPPENPVYYPAWSIALPDGSDSQLASKQLQETAIQYLPQAILADTNDFESIWTQYVYAISKINVKAYEDAINAEIQDRIKNWGGTK